MIKKNSIIPIWLIVVYGGAIIVSITDWGSPASIVTVGITSITALALFSKWSYYKWAWNHPFKKVWYILQDDTDSKPDLNGSTACQDYMLSNSNNLKTSRDKIKVSQGKYHLYVELSPRMSFKISDINFRFRGDDKSRPEVLEVHDTGWRRIYSNFNCRKDLALGIDCHYEPLTIVNRGKDLYYIISFSAQNIWRGKLSLLFYIEDRGARPVRIRCDVE